MKMTYDIIISGGTVVDGTGRPGSTADIGITAGVIRDVAPSLAAAKAKTVVPAAGKIVAPGFIDITNHADQNFAIFKNPTQDALLAQGITTILLGNCGSSLAPLTGRDAIESVRRWTEGNEMNVNWLSVGEYLAEIERHRPGVNIATLAGHGTIRRGVLKNETRPLAPEELQIFAETFRRAVQEGAFGLSTGLVYSHEVDATPDEIAVFLRLVKETGTIYKTHIRHEGTDLVPAVNEVIQLGKATGTSIVISHFKAIGRKAWPFFTRTIRMIEGANDAGASIHFDISPYQRTGSFLYLLLPRWVRKGGFRALLERLADPQQRTYLIEDLRRQTIDASRYIIASASVPGMNGRTIAEIASRSGISPEETIVNLIETSRGRVTILGKAVSFRNITLGIRNALAIIASDGSGVSLELEKSGKLVHPRSTGAFPHFLHRFVRERKDLTWEEAIRRITSLPAAVVGFVGRGMIAPNYAADLVVFDPETIRDRSTYESPYTRAQGVSVVLVNGKIAWKDGAVTTERAGQVLRKK